MSKKPIYGELEKRILELEKAEYERNLIEEALSEKKRTLPTIIQKYDERFCPS